MFWVRNSLIRTLICVGRLWTDAACTLNQNSSTFKDRLSPDRATVAGRGYWMGHRKRRMWVSLDHSLQFYPLCAPESAPIAYAVAFLRFTALHEQIERRLAVRNGRCWIPSTPHQSLTCPSPEDPYRSIRYFVSALTREVALQDARCPSETLAECPFQIMRVMEVRLKTCHYHPGLYQI